MHSKVLPRGVKALHLRRDALDLDVQRDEESTAAFPEEDS